MALQNICPLCGKVNPESEWVCEDCGTKLPAAGRRDISSPQTSVPASAPVQQPVSQLPPEYAHLQRQMDTAGQGFFTLFIGVAILIGLVGAFTFLKDARSQSWPTVQGQIITSRIERHNSMGRAGRRDRGPSYSPSVRYVYHVNGNRHEGYRITSIGWRGNADAARAGLKAYPVGAKVPVYYNPTNPSESLLEPQNQSNNLGMIGIGAVFVGIGALGAFLWFRSSRRTLN